MGNFLNTYSFSIDELIKIIRKEFSKNLQMKNYT